MMGRIALFVIGSLLVLTPRAESVLLCDVNCTETTSCSQKCREYVGGPQLTCGEWGVCQSGGGCYPNYQPVSGTPIGAFQVNYYNPNSCQHIVLERLTWHDQNNCPGSSDYQTCHSYVNATRDDHFCCYFYTCGGQTSC